MPIAMQTGTKASKSDGPGMILVSSVGTHKVKTAIRSEIEKLADSKASVLITGPTGSGKDVVTPTASSMQLSRGTPVRRAQLRRGRTRSSGQRDVRP